MFFENWINTVSIGGLIQEIYGKVTHIYTLNNLNRTFMGILLQMSSYLFIDNF